MKRAVIDCSGVQTVEQFWQLYVQTTNPEGKSMFGRNLDALWDALKGGPGWPGECILVITGTEQLKRVAEGRLYEGLKSMSLQTDLLEVE